MNFIKLINKLLYSGTSESARLHLSRRILFSNVIYLTLPVVYLSFILLDIKVYLNSPFQLNFDQLVVPFMIAYCFIGLFFNRYGYSYLGRVLFLILWPLLMHIIPIILLQTPADYYLAFPIGIIFHAVLIQLTISFQAERKTLLVFMALNLGLIVFAREILLFFEDSSEEFLPGGLVTSLYYSLVGILYWLLFNTITFYVTRVLDRVIERNDLQRQLLATNNHQLVQLNAKIESVNKSLEEKVTRRTRQLEESNKRLTSYAYYNAHTIRGPFCRIKGILMLKDLKAISEEDFQSKMDQSIGELEKAIDSMQLKLNDYSEPGTIDKVTDATHNVKKQDRL